ncbi:MAG: hypothetical protein L6R39_006697 [Caloplaca ligustica]|nr:MAG: hypothetical protein L6R39_006697 [Caloplaca ligustica]
MADEEVATKAPESDAQETSATGDTKAQEGPSMGVYISKPSDYPHQPSKLLLFLSSGTGIHSKNNQLQADKYASEGFVVVAPDQFGGDALSNTATDPTAAPDTNASMIEKVKMGFADTAKAFMIDMWLARQSQEKVLPLLHKVIEGAKDEFADAVANGDGIYAVGYCFGGKYVLLLGSELPDTVAKGQTMKDEEQGVVTHGPQIKAGAIAHGTQITKDDIESLKVPVTMACTENDPLFPDEVRAEAQKYLVDNNITHEIQVFPGVPHELKAPTPTQSDDPTGLNVCLYCFNGGCCSERDHAKLHYQSTKHPLVLNIKRTRKKIKREEPPQKISKLAIAAETEEDRFDTTTAVRCYECRVENVDKTSGKLPAVVDAVLKANTFARQAEVQAWEQEITPCEHTLCLKQEAARQIESQDLGHCSMCELKENLWLCLQCGNLGCGRQQFGGVGGNSHGLKHTELTSHAVAVKLGSLTPDGTADIYCYACNEERTDPELAAHLAHWGINIAEREKTERSLTEMQIEQNLRWEFSMTTEDGKVLKPLFGEGFTGLKNLGNSCYLASVLQCLFSIPAFRDRYYHPQDPPPFAEKPAEDLETQLRKVADGILSGRYSYPDSDVTASEDSPYIPHQRGLPPAMLKHLIGRGHEEFSTMRQQDAFELLLHLFKLIARSPHPAPAQDPVKVFRFVMEQRLQCISCNRVRYRSDEQDNISIPVPVRRKLRVINSDSSDEKPKDEFEPVTLKECLDILTGAEEVDLTCPVCGSKAGFTKRSLFKTFPDVLAVNARRFELVNWVPTKLDVPVVVDDEPFNLDAYMSSGQQDGEEILPEEQSDPATKFTPNQASLEQLEVMGFPRVRCEKALHATGNGGADEAMNWLFAHMDDPDIDAPLELKAPVGSGAAATAGVVDRESVEMMAAMGIGAPQARKALKETGGDVNRAVDWVFSHPNDQGDFDSEGSNPGNGHSGQGVAGSADLPARFRLQSIVCHKGSSIHAGHYVAFIRKPIPHDDNGDGDNGGAAGDEEVSWVLYNDEKVVRAVHQQVEEMKKFAYVYFFMRI